MSIFQVVDGKGVTVMRTDFISCIPDNNQLTSMSKSGYKFKIDGKGVSIKKVKEERDSNLHYK